MKMPDLDLFKKLFFEKSLEFGEIGVRFLAGFASVQVPAFIDRGTPVVFAYGLAQARPIPDLEITDQGISATLAFGSEFHKTFVPWNSILSIGSIHFGIVFPVIALSEELPEPSPEPKKPKLRSV